MTPLTIRERLAGGDRRSVVESNSVASDVADNSELFDELFTAVFDADIVVRVHAADAVEKISRTRPEWLRPYKAAILDLLTHAAEKEVRWHLAQLVSRLPLTSSERGNAAAAMTQYLDDRSSIVKACALQALADLSEQDRHLRGDVARLLERALRNGTPAMRARARKLLPRVTRLRDL